MDRTWIRRGLTAAVVCAVAALALGGTCALAADDSTVLVGVSADRGPQMAKKLVVKRNNTPYVTPVPGQPRVPDESEPPKTGIMSISDGKGPIAGSGAIGGVGGGVAMLPSATPEMRVEKSLKDLARDLR